MDILVDTRFAEMSLTLKGMFEDRPEGMDESVPLPSIKANMMEAIIEYCEHY